MRNAPVRTWMVMLLVIGVWAPLRAQSVRVESKTGYVLRLPEGSALDNARSGWSQKGSYEQRVYRIDGTGEIRIIATVKPVTVPNNATISEAYTWFDSDSATSGGTAFIRTYYLPTRSVRIELVPYGSRMHDLIEGREAIFGTFRWKPGAESDRIDVDK